jgi:RNA polymerase sigma factor (sigma-70 family)
VEASVFEAPAGLARNRVAIGPRLLRLRSDEQLVALFREGYDDAFRIIHDRYYKRLLAYVRQMLPRRPDAEDALQDVFVRAYFGLRAHERELSLRAWLFRVAHNRCIDELRRPAPPPAEIVELRSHSDDPAATAEQRESLRRLIADVRRLPDQQRSALLMRELGGMSYADLAVALEVSVPAIKSLLVRARVGLVQAAEARDTACTDIRQALVEAHEGGVRPAAMARRHMRDCSGCRSFRRELRGVSRELAALTPAAGLTGLLAKLLGGSGGASGSSSSAGGGACGVGASGSSAAAGFGAGGTASGAGIVIGTNHVAALIAAAVATGGAVEIPSTIAPAFQGKPAAPAAGKSVPGATAAAPSGEVVVYAETGQVVVVPAGPVSVGAAAASPAPSASAIARRAAAAAGSAGLAGAATGAANGAAKSAGPPPAASPAPAASQPAPTDSSAQSTPVVPPGPVVSAGTTPTSGTSGGSGSPSGSSTSQSGGTSSSSTSSSSTSSGSSGSSGTGSPNTQATESSSGTTSNSGSGSFSSGSSSSTGGTSSGPGQTT